MQSYATLQSYRTRLSPSNAPSLRYWALCVSIGRFCTYYSWLLMCLAVPRFGRALPFSHWFSRQTLGTQCGSWTGALCSQSGLPIAHNANNWATPRICTSSPPCFASRFGLCRAPRQRPHTPAPSTPCSRSDNCSKILGKSPMPHPWDLPGQSPGRTAAWKEWLGPLGFGT